MKRNGYRLIAALLALGIFAFDTWSNVQVAVAVLHILAVLIVARTARRRDIVVAGTICVALTITSYVSSYGFTFVDRPALRAVISLSAIGIATWLTLYNQQATEALSDQARLLNLTRDMIFVRDRDGRITFWNRAAEEVYGWSAAEAIGHCADELLATQYPWDRRTIEQHLLDIGRWDGELVQFAKSGARLVVESRWALQRDEHGDMLGILETHTDVTERKLAQEALSLAQAELAHAARVATLGELTASVVHEVSQPLMAVVTNAEAGRRWLRRAPPDVHEVDMAIGHVVAEGRRASEIVTRIRAFIKKEPVQRHELDIATLAEEAALLVQRELARADVELQLTIEPGLPVVLGDKIQLQQVLVNIMVNAAQAMTSHAGRRQLSLQALRSGPDSILIDISDTGPGIAEDHIEQIFDPFFTTKESGMGMGLAISRTIIEAHGGRLAVSSSPGQGATFQLALSRVQGL
ncbi:MAG: ATP-binding protein [Pseudomonadota bacterium]